MASLQRSFTEWKIQGIESIFGHHSKSWMFKTTSSNVWRCVGRRIQKTGRMFDWSEWSWRKCKLGCKSIYALISSSSIDCALFRKANIFDNMLAIMEKYAYNLEGLVQERTNQLYEEKKKTETLLLRMLPKLVFQTIMTSECDNSLNFYLQNCCWVPQSWWTRPSRMFWLCNDFLQWFGWLHRAVCFEYSDASCWNAQRLVHLLRFNHFKLWRLQSENFNPFWRECSSKAFFCRSRRLEMLIW